MNNYFKSTSLKSTYFLSLILCVFYFISSAQAQQNNIPDKGRHSVPLDSEGYVEFVRGNKILFSEGTGIQYLDGVVSRITVTGHPLEVSNWVTPKGKKYPLSCGALSPSLLQLIRKPWEPAQPAHSRAPLIWFHDNGEYKSGCHAVSTFHDSTDGDYDVTVGAGSMISLFDDGELEYLSSLHSGKLMFANDWIELEQRSELYKYKSGSPKFFTPIKGTELISNTKYGNIKLAQIHETRPIAWVFYDDGHVQSAILGQDVKLANYTVEKGLGVKFYVCLGNTVNGMYGSNTPCDVEDKRPYLDSVLFNKTKNFATKNKYLIKTKFIDFYQDGFIFSARLENSLVFKGSDGREIPLEKGDLVIFDKEFNLIDVTLTLNEPTR